MIFTALPPGSLAAAPSQPTAQSPVETRVELEPITVHARRVANVLPAGTITTAATELRFDPQIDVQSRGFAENQADITVRGGLFENTGFRIGAVPLFDPQTGHYAVELPIDPAMLTSPRTQTGVEHGLHGFNAAVASVVYGLRPVVERTVLGGGAGSHGSLFGSFLSGQAMTLKNGDQLGVEASVAASNGAGGLPFSDHEYSRFTGRVEHSDEDTETHALIGYQDKFFGWPGAYTGFASLPETDHSKVGLLLIDHRRTGDSGWWELGAAYRWLDDDYDFDRRTVESGGPGSFEHETRSFALGVEGVVSAADLDWAWSGQWVADRLVRSTDLTNGDFNSRTYAGLGLVPRWKRKLADNRMLILGAGLRADISNRDEDALLPLFEIALEWSGDQSTNRLGLDYTRTSQVPGYTALNSPPAGLFGGNPDLGRAHATTTALSFERTTLNLELSTALFYRRDDDLVDWTYRAGAPFARQANTVDMDVTGWETAVIWRNSRAEFVGGYTYIHKDEDYGTAAVDASYYALNHARHRFTFALTWQPLDALAFRLDTEYRVQLENPLRVGNDRAFNGSASLTWQLPMIRNASLGAVIDNLTDDDFQEFPGTPAIGRRGSVFAELVW